MEDPGKDERQARPVIELQGVEKRLGGQSVLSRLDLTVQAGGTVVLMGASGCGKSTLLRCLDALEPVDAGIIRVLGEDLHSSALDVNAFRARIGMVFQQFNLFPHLSVLQNITLAPMRLRGLSRQEAETQARDLLARVGLPDKADVSPSQLSGGQQQRVAIARSLAMQPELMLLDEPTSALDPPMTREVLSVIQEIAREDGITLVIVTHEVGFAERVADRIIFLDQGRIIEEGSPAQILHQPKHVITQAYLDALNAADRPVTNHL